MAYVAAYAISAYSTTADRTTKPFNPLLGETFEFDRIADLGWRCIAEQVSHHAPIAARHCEGKKWVLYLQAQFKSRFHGKSLSVQPAGTIHIHFKNSGHHYTFQKVTTTVHLLARKYWLDNHGDMHIVNHANGDKAAVSFIQYSYLSRENHKVNGIVRNKQNEAKWVIEGFWDKYVTIAAVDKEEKVKWPRKIWTINPPIANAAKMYGFTKFTIEMNEEPDKEGDIAPTDSRHRPDQRAMELGNWEKAKDMKEKLEVKQRKFAAKVEDSYRPKWFEQTLDPYTGEQIYTLIKSDIENNKKEKEDDQEGEYWRCKTNRDWTRCPDIYL